MIARSLLPFASGALFAGGLVVAGMTRPSKVIGFLDVAGAWDPSLALVMVGAIGVMTIAWRIAGRRRAPLAGGEFSLPTRRDIDGRLVAGAAVFGVGWGLGGYCPGPGLTATTAGVEALVFVPAMLSGMSVVRWLDRSRAQPRERLLAATPDQLER